MTPEAKKMALSFGASASSAVVLPAVVDLTLWASIADQDGAQTDCLIDTVSPVLPTMQQFQDYEDR